MESITAFFGGLDPWTVFARAAIAIMAAVLVGRMIFKGIRALGRSVPKKTIPPTTAPTAPATGATTTRKPFLKIWGIDIHFPGSPIWRIVITLLAAITIVGLIWLFFLAASLVPEAQPYFTAIGLRPILSQYTVLVLLVLAILLAFARENKAAKFFAWSMVALVAWIFISGTDVNESIKEFGRMPTSAPATCATFTFEKKPCVFGDDKVTWAYTGDQPGLYPCWFPASGFDMYHTLKGSDTVIPGPPGPGVINIGFHYPPPNKGLKTVVIWLATTQAGCNPQGQQPKNDHVSAEEENEYN